MAAPAMPVNVYATQGNATVAISWDLVAGASSYSVLRSTDQITYASVASPTLTSYLDSSVTVGTQYWYKVQAVGTGGTSSASAPVTAIPAIAGCLSLYELRTQAQTRADMLGSKFLSVQEWNRNINAAYFELYDLLSNVHEDYYLATTISLTTDGQTQQFPLPNGINYSGAQPFKSLIGVDLGVGGLITTVNRFQFIERNRYLYQNTNTIQAGFNNLRYKVIGNSLMCTPVPGAGQTLTLWYEPRMKQLMLDTDIADGVNGWLDYVVVRAAKMALDKEESDSSALTAELLYLKTRIEESAQNRDQGEPARISATRRYSGNGTNGEWENW